MSKPPPKILPRVRRVRTAGGVRKLALTVLQQQLENMKDRELNGNEREFVIAVAKALGPAAKAQESARKEPVSAGMKDPLGALGE